MMAIDWSRLGDSAEAAYKQLHEETVAHIVRLYQVSPAWARSAVREHLDGAHVPSPCKGFCLFPTLPKDVKARLDELGIETAGAQ